MADEFEHVVSNELEPWRLATLKRSRERVTWLLRGLLPFIIARFDRERVRKLEGFSPAQFSMRIVVVRSAPGIELGASVAAVTERLDSSRAHGE